MQSNDNGIIVHQVNVAHYRLIQLTTLAEQGRPFYEWVERIAKKESHSDISLDVFLMTSNISNIEHLINAVYFDTSLKKPHLFDGAGRIYKHKKASFFFFSWLIRDAPQQRLSPLIVNMRKMEGKQLKKEKAEIDTLSRLFVEYRNNVRNFKWESVREVFVDRLEGSRRSISGHLVEANVRAAFVTAIQSYYSANLDYGNFDSVDISNSQVKVGNDTADIRIQLLNGGVVDETIYIPIKSRETQGGGHAHLFTRDIETAITNIKTVDKESHIIAVIIAENWDAKELNNLNNAVDLVFHFDMNPNQFQYFDENAQLTLNRYIGGLLDGNKKQSAFG